jgi:adenylate cyclase
MDFVLKQRIFRYVLGFSLIVLFISHAAGYFPIPFIDTLDNQIYDLRLSMTLPENVDKKVVIIDIDEKSLAEIGQWPWDRKTMGNIIENLFSVYNINVIGFDIVFAEKDENPSDKYLVSMAKGPLAENEEFLSVYNKAKSSLQRDKLFAQSLKNRNTVLGIVFYDDDEVPKKGGLPDPIPEFTKDIIDSFAFKQAQSYTANLDILQKNALTAGFFDNPILDDDGVFRKVPLLQEHKGKMYESLALAVTRAALKNNDIKIGYESLDETGVEKSLEWVYVGDIAIPVDENSGVLVPYIGRQHSFEYISAVDVLNKKVSKNKLKNKIALFGTSAAGLLDLRTTPLEKSFPGVEVHANIIQGILDQTIKHKPEYLLGFEILMLMVLGIILTFTLPALSPVWGSFAMASSMASLVAIDYVAWNNWNMVLPIASPLSLVALLYILNMTYGFFVESRGKRQLTHLFGQYVPPDLVDEMSKNLTEINLDGEIRNMSVLFTDVRGFTTISENMEPKELTEYINNFLTPLTAVIHHNRGTIDKYMGDAIMAFWGAPLEDHQHARNALETGLQLQKAIDKLNITFKKQGKPEIRIGVGVNTGDMNVGNKGSEFRVDYTVLGDAVNLGSRLEGLTKNYDVDMLTSDSTRHAVPEFEYRELDLVRVKGKDKPVKLFEPLGLVEDIDKGVRTTVKQFHHAIKLYREQKWDDAEKEIFALSQADPDRRIYQIYLDRIAYFRNNNPGPDWDGVFTHTSK